MTPRARFFVPSSERETSLHLALLARIDEFWSTFLRSCGGSQTRWVPALRELLADIHGGLGLEVRAQPDGTWVLAVLPVGDVSLRPLVALFLARAPHLFPWSFESSRQPRPLGEALRIVQQDTQLELSAARCRVGVGRGHLVRVVVASHLFAGATPEAAQDAAEQVVELLVGDEAFEDWVEEVSWIPAARAGPLHVLGTDESQLPLLLSQLADAFETARKSVWGALPDAPYHRFCEHAEWTMFELGEDEALPQHVQPDLRVAGTICPEMLKCFLLGSPFSSNRFSRHGERFCILKLACLGSPDEQLAFRQALEDELDRILVPGLIGCVVGNGIGTEFMYVYLALQQVDAAIDIVRRKLRNRAALSRGWLLFCDAEWRDEWVDLAEDSSA